MHTTGGTWSDALLIANDRDAQEDGRCIVSGNMHGAAGADWSALVTLATDMETAAPLGGRRFHVYRPALRAEWVQRFSTAT